ncbi:MAG: host attachment protein [Deltaproteobacteria bacterium]|nr:host attachment protein [Deltaproteobacteria bacterium]
MMTSTWIVVAHEAGARFFENRGRGTGLELIEEVEHPEGRARDRDMASDRPGRSFRKNSGDPSRASLSQSEGPHDRAVSDFARALADKLQDAQLVMASLDKDLAASKRDEIVERLGDLITL